MSTHLTSIKIDSYRGMKNVLIDDLSEINILLGDNNCGKTSVLEVLSTIESPCHFMEWHKNIFSRQSIFNRDSFYSSIKQLFSIDDDNLCNSYQINFIDGQSARVVFTLKSENVSLTVKDIEMFDRYAYRTLKIQYRNDGINNDNQIINTNVYHCEILNEFKGRQEKAYYDIYPFTKRIGVNRRFEEKNFYLYHFIV